MFELKYNEEDGSVLTTELMWLHAKMSTLFQYEKIKDALTLAAPRPQG